MTMAKKLMVISLSIPKLFTNAFTYVILSHHYNISMKLAEVLLYLVINKRVSE